MERQIMYLYIFRNLLSKEEPMFTYIYYQCCQLSSFLSDQSINHETFFLGWKMKKSEKIFIIEWRNFSFFRSNKKSYMIVTQI